MIKNYNMDIMDWDRFPDYDMIWTDPPWRDGMVKFFQTQMKKDTGRTVNHTSEEIMDQLARLADPCKPIIIEYSVTGWLTVVRIMENRGHKIIKVDGGTYSAKRLPFVLMNFNYEIPVYSGHGAEIITNTLRGVPDIKTVFDPFAGIGFTAKAARAAGKIYIGSELNPKRFARLCKENP